MRKNRLIIISLFLCIFTHSTYSQVETRSLKTEKDYWELKNLDRIKLCKESPVKILPSFDTVRELAEDDAQRDSRDGFRYGKAFDVSYTLQDGTWSEIDDGYIWSLTVESPKAISLNFLLKDVKLPHGAYIYILNEDKTMMFGNITQECLNKDGNILTDLLAGSSSTIYLYEPTKVKGQSKLTISRIIHGLREIPTELDNPDMIRSRGESSSCNIDIACKPTYSTEAKAIGMIMTSTGIIKGTGSLVMTTNRSFIPYFLTAFHLIDKDHNNILLFQDIDEISNWAVKFNYRKETCEGTILATSVIYSGISYVSAWGEDHTDFALLQLNENIKHNPNIYFLGWDKSENVPTSGSCIHHPQGDVMKISVENNSFQSTYWNGQYMSQSNDHWQVIFDEGIMQDGSSGSPILNQYKRVVGQMHGGPTYPNACNNTTAKFGKFSLSWLGGGTSTSQLKCWLDPNNTGATTMDGSYPPGLQAEIVGDPVICNANTYTLTGVPSIYTIQWSLSNTTNFSITPGADSTCVVSFVGSGETSTVLTARVYYGSLCIRTVTKILYHHSGLVFSGSQQAGYDNGHFYAARDSIVYVTDVGTGINGYEISPCSNVTLISDAFQGMEMDCYGVTPLTWEQQHNTLTFSVPANHSAYGFQITGSSSGHCSDFNIPMRVDMTEVPQMEGGLTPYIEGYTLHIHFGYESLDDPPLYLPDGASWYLTAYRLNSSVLTYSTTVYGEDVYIPLNTFLSGYYYLFRGEYEGNIYTCKVLIP